MDDTIYIPNEDLNSALQEAVATMRKDGRLNSDPVSSALKDGRTVKEVAQEMATVLIKNGIITQAQFATGFLQIKLGTHQVLFTAGETHLIADTSEQTIAAATNIRLQLVPYMRDLAQFGYTTMNSWFNEWSTVRAKAAPTAIAIRQELVVFQSIFMQVNDTLSLLSDGAERVARFDAGPGITGSIAVLVRTQMESYWGLSLLLKDDALRDKRVAAYAFMFVRAIERHNLRRLQEQASPDITARIAEEQRSKAAATADPYFADARNAWSTGNPMYWYNLIGFRKLRGVAEEVGEKSVYEDLYDYVSAVAHGLAPNVGRLADYDDATNNLVMLPDLGMITSLLFLGVTYTRKVCELLVTKLMSEDNKKVWADFWMKLGEKHGIAEQDESPAPTASKP